MTLVQARLCRSPTRLCSCFLAVRSIPTPIPTCQCHQCHVHLWSVKSRLAVSPWTGPLTTRKWCGEERVPKWKGLVLEYLPALLAFADWLSRRGCGRVWIWWDSRNSWNASQRPNLQFDFSLESLLGLGQSMCIFATFDGSLGGRQRRKRLGKMHLPGMSSSRLQPCVNLVVSWKPCDAC